MIKYRSLEVHELTASQRGDFEREALPHLDTLYRYALGFARDPAQAEDWVQDAMVKAYRAWRSYEPGNVRGWLITILRNTIVSHHRRSGRLESVDMSEMERYWRDDEGSSDPERRAERALVRDRVHSAISRLPGRFREAVILSDIEGFSYGEVAEATAVPVGTVKSRIFRGRRILAEELRGYALRMGYVARPD